MVMEALATSRHQSVTICQDEYKVMDHPQATPADSTAIEAADTASVPMDSVRAIRKLLDVIALL